jgi:hypothetical protein
LTLLRFRIPDSAWHSNADLNPASQNNADICGTGTATLPPSPPSLYRFHIFDDDVIVYSPPPRVFPSRTLISQKVMRLKTFLPVQILEPLLLMKLSVEGKGFDPQQVKQVHQPAHTVDTVAENDRPALQMQEQISEFVSQILQFIHIFYNFLFRGPFLWSRIYLHRNRVKNTYGMVLGLTQQQNNTKHSFYLNYQ